MRRRRARALLLVAALAHRARVVAADASRRVDFRTGASAVATSRRTFEVNGAFDGATLEARDIATGDVAVALVMDTGERRTARVGRDGRFALRDVPPGTHRVDARAIGLTFPPLVVTVDEVGGVVATYAEDRSVRVETMPLKMTPVSTAEYFEPAPTVSLRALAKNPMFLMCCMMVFAYFAPKLLDAIDPDELQELVGGGAPQPRPDAPRAQAASTSNANKVD